MRSIVILSLLILYSFLANAQGKNEVSKWYVPDFVTGQYAGSIGFISVGTGYDIFKQKASVEFLVGYVPGFTGSKSIEVLTLKFTARSFEMVVNEKLTLYPLTSGVYFSYVPGREYSSDLPSWYPDGYYWWSEAIRANIFVGGKARIAITRTKAGNYLSPYYEIGTNEIKLVSYVQNASSLSFWSILHAGIGVRYHF
jgi:hypothetical protein